MRGFGPLMLAAMAVFGDLLLVTDGKEPPDGKGPLVCEEPPNWQIDGKDLMREHRGKVVVVALLMANCHFCLWQATQLSVLLAKYNQTGMTELRSFVVNDQSSIRVAHHLRRRAYPIPLYQDRAGSDVWKKLQGGKDDFYIYDRCGRLAYYIPYPISFLYKPYVSASILSTYYEEPCGPCPPSVEEIIAINNCTNLIDKANSTDGELLNPNSTIHINITSETTTAASLPTTSDHNNINDEERNATGNSSTNSVRDFQAVKADATIATNTATTESIPHIRTPDHRHGGHMKHYPKSYEPATSSNETSGKNHRDENRPYQHTTGMLTNDINGTVFNATSSPNTTIGDHQQQITNNSTEAPGTKEDSANSTTQNSAKPSQNNGTLIDVINSELDDDSTDPNSKNVSTSNNQCKMPYNIPVTSSHTVRTTYDNFYPNYEKILNVALETWLQKLVAPSGITSTPKPIPRANITPKISDRGRSTLPWRIRHYRHGHHATRGEEAASDLL